MYITYKIHVRSQKYISFSMDLNIRDHFSVCHDDSYTYMVIYNKYI